MVRSKPLASTFLYLTRWRLAAAMLVVLLILTGCDAATGPPPAVCAPGARASTDGWELLIPDSDTLGGFADVATSPFDPDLILVGTIQDFSSGTPGSLYRSTDNGASWQTVLVGGSYEGVYFSPADPELAFALPFGVYKSTDGGQTWFPSEEGILIDFDTRVQTLGFDPHDPTGQTVFAGTGGFFGGTLYRSTDGGQTWARTTEPPTCEDPYEPACRLEDGVISLAFDPARASVLYVGTAGLGDVLKSEDGGQTWSVALGESGGLVEALVVDAADPDVVYASLNFGAQSGAGQVQRSEDGGQTWSPYDAGLPESARAGRMVQDPATQALYLLADSFGGVGTVWRRAEQPFWRAFGPEGVVIGATEALHLSPDGWLYAGAADLWRQRVRSTTATEPGPCPP